MALALPTANYAASKPEGVSGRVAELQVADKHLRVDWMTSRIVRVRVTKNRYENAQNVKETNVHIGTFVEEADQENSNK